MPRSPSADSLRNVPLKANNPPPPDWAVEGQAVEHTKFGRGRVTGTGLVKRQWAIFVQFEGFAKALDTIYGPMHMRPVPDDPASAEVRPT